MTLPQKLFLAVWTLGLLGVLATLIAVRILARRDRARLAAMAQKEAAGRPRAHFSESRRLETTLSPHPKP